jgi:hypothetical protein
LLGTFSVWNPILVCKVDGLVDLEGQVNSPVRSVGCRNHYFAELLKQSHYLDVVFCEKSWGEEEFLVPNGGLALFLELDPSFLFLFLGVRHQELFKVHGQNFFDSGHIFTKEGIPAIEL